MLRLAEQRGRNEEGVQKWPPTIHMANQMSIKTCEVGVVDVACSSALSGTESHTAIAVNNVRCEVAGVVLIFDTQTTRSR